MATDEEIIERVRRRRRTRRAAGSAALLMGAALLALVAWATHYLRVRALALLAPLDPAATPTTEALQQRFDQAQFGMGWALGMAISGGLYIAVSLLVLGLWFLFTRNCVDELLLRCWGERSPDR